MGRPLYTRLLRLRHVRPGAWQRAVLGEGAFVVALLVVLADRATAWLLVVLPLAVAAATKFHDVLVGALRSSDWAPDRVERAVTVRDSGGAASRRRGR